MQPDIIQATIDLLAELIKTPSVNGQENEGVLINKVIEICKGFKLPYQVFEKEAGRPNLYIGDPYLFAKKEGLLLVTHGDTVPIGDESRWIHDPFGAEIVDGKMYGRGALDCKGGIAIGLQVMKILRDSEVKIKMIIGADEESGADSKFGIKYVLDQGLQAKSAIYLYGGTAKNELTIGHRGVLRVWVTCHGESAHSGSKDWQKNEKGASALEAMISFVQKALTLSYNVKSDYFRGYTFKITPTIMNSGSGESIVPDTAKVLFDIRTMPGQNNDQIIKDLINISENISSEKISFKYEVKNNVPAALTDPNATIVDLAKKTMQKVYGFRDKIILKGSGPANESYMLINAGIPTIVGFGPEGEGFHAANEYAEIDSIKRSINFVSGIANSL